MPRPAPDESTNFTDALGALASPARISLIKELRTPKTVTKIKLRFPSKKEGEDHLVARQTVKHHLDLLVEIGVVIARETERSHGRTMDYVVNHQVLYSLGEDVRSLARLRPTELPPGTTRASLPAAQASRRGGPSWVLVEGLDGGHVFELTPPATGTTEWIIGRRRGLPVALDFDAFVSSENSRVHWDGRLST